MRITFNKKGAERKALVTAVGEILNTKPKYKGMPSAAYEFIGFIIDKEGNLEFEDCVYPKDVQRLLEKLADRGFVPKETYEELTEDQETEDQETVDFTVRIPIDKVGVHNLTNLLEAKNTLIKKALGLTAISIDVREEWVEFPWFDKVSSEEARTYAKFIDALCKMTKVHKRINAIEKPASNEKYAFRGFLLRLGFIGDEYKVDRRILLKNLTGSAAYKNGGPKR